MECPRCGAINQTEVGSCLSCGAPFAADESLPTIAARPSAPARTGPRLGAGAPPRQCPNCMTFNAATFKFCARCGTPLGATGPAQATAPAQTTPGKPAPVQTAPGKPAPVQATIPGKPPVPRPAAPAHAAALAPAVGPAAPVPLPGAPAAPKPPARPVAAAPAPAPAAKTAPPAPPAVTAKPPVPAARPAPPPPPKPVTRAPPPPPPRPAAPARPRARVSAIARDGSTSADFVLVKDETKVGREVAQGEVKLDKDPFIAPLHAVFRFNGPQLLIQDSGTANGVFVCLKERQLQSGDELRIGRQRLRVEWMPQEPEVAADQPLWGSPDPGYAARVVQLLEGGGEGDVFPLHPGENLLGRGSGDVSFPQDGYVSSRHATLTVGEGQLAVKDLGSANGTFVRIQGEAPVNPGDLLLVGEQILRVDPA